MEKFTPVFHKTLKAFNDPRYNLIASKGGQGSSKTISNLQLMILNTMFRKKKTVTTIVSHSYPHLKKGVMRDAEKLLADEGIDFNSNFNQQNKILKLNGNIIEFVSADNMASHGIRRDFLYINEANAIKYEVFRQQFNRTNGTTIIDFNHIGEFWYDKELREEPEVYKVKEIVSTWLDNPFIPEKEKWVMANAVPGTWFHDVYVLGKMGRAMGVVFSNWEQGEFDMTLPYVYGVDFGVTNPDTVSRVAVDEKNKIIYVQQMHYQRGNNTEDLLEVVSEIAEEDNRRANRHNRYEFQYKRYDVPFICDPADKRAINDMKNIGLNCPYFAKPEVVWSLRQMQDYKIIVCGDSPKIIHELNNYKWDESKSIPVKENDHAIDGIRYGFLYLTSGAKAGNWYDRKR